MTIDSNTITYIIGGAMLLLLGLPVIIKQYYVMKTKGKTLVRTVTGQEEETSYLLKLEGLTTEPNSKNRAYVPRGKHTDPKTKKTAGNTFETWYPEGLPRFLQVRVRAMATPEGDPTGVNFYGDQEDIKLTDFQIGVIHKEAFSKVAIAASNDSRDMLKELKGFTQPLNKGLVYGLLAVILLAVAGSAYLGYMVYQAMLNAGWI